MKNHFLVALLFLIFFSCDKKENKEASNNEQSDGFTISGKVLSPEKEGYIVLEELSDENIKKIDSVKANTDGTYKITGRITEPGFYRLNFYNKQTVVVVLENNPMVVNANGANPNGFSEVTGSKATSDFIGVSNLMQEFQNSRQELDQTIMKQKVIDTPAVMQQFETMRIHYVERIKDSIRDMGPSVTAVFATSYLDKDQEFPFFDSLATVLEKELPNSKYSKQFIDNVNFMRKVSVGRQAPNISLANPDGQVVTLESLRGKYVLIDFWASWCGPCRQENPNVVRMYNRFKNKNFEIYGVSLDNDKFKWVQAIEKDGLSWKHVSDLKGWQSEAAASYNVAAIPVTYLIDKEGKIIAKNLRGKDLEKKLEEILL